MIVFRLQVPQLMYNLESLYFVKFIFIPFRGCRLRPTVILPTNVVAPGARSQGEGSQRGQRCWAKEAAAGEGSNWFFLGISWGVCWGVFCFNKGAKAKCSVDWNGLKMWKFPTAFFSAVGKDCIWHMVQIEGFRTSQEGFRGTLSNSSLRCWDINQRRAVRGSYHWTSGSWDQICRKGLPGDTKIRLIGWWHRGSFAGRQMSWNILGKSRGGNHEDGAIEDRTSKPCEMFWAPW